MKKKVSKMTTNKTKRREQKKPNEEQNGENLVSVFKRGKSERNVGGRTDKIKSPLAGSCIKLYKKGVEFL